MKKFIIRIYDIIIAIIIFFTKWVFINFRKRGPENLPITSKFLKKSGLYPIIKHYYDPKFEYSNNEKKYLFKQKFKIDKSK